MKRGFTLIAMLVVIGIIAVLIAASVASFGGPTRKAEIAKGRELVSNVSTALATIYQKGGRWPSGLVKANGSDENRLGEKPAIVLAQKNALSLSYSSKSGLLGDDRYGVVDPWGMKVLKGNSKANLNSNVPSGGTVRDHILRFAIDVDGTGITSANVCGQQIRVRAPAIVWCTGPDGKFGKLDEMGRSDDIFSFTAGQIVK